MKIVLAYSGGLDTSVALRWLAERHQADVFAFCADIGQLEDVEEVRSKALLTGAADAFVDDAVEPFLRDFAFRGLRANAVYERKYLVAAPMSRPFICQRLLRYARRIGADAVAHGATGKGNDNVRFAAGFAALAPDMPVLTPVLDWDMHSREAELQYAAEHEISVPVDAERPYSIDSNIWGTSIECGVLDDIGQPPPREVYMMTRDADATGAVADHIMITFESGVPVALDGVPLGPVELVRALNDRAGAQGIGRIDIVENRVVGIKTRGIYESPGGTVLHAALRELEAVSVDRDTLRTADLLGQRYGQLIYEGLWHSPLREALDGFFSEMHRRTSGDVTMRLHRGLLTVHARDPLHSLYSPTLATYGTDDAFDHRAGAGFAYAWSLPLRSVGFSSLPVRGQQEYRRP